MGSTWGFVVPFLISLRWAILWVLSVVFLEAAVWFRPFLCIVLKCFESPVVDTRVWCSQRIHFGVVQVGQLAISVVTVYLWPNAPLSSRRYAENCEVIGAAVQLIRPVSGPAILAGDFNASHALFQEVRDLVLEGWADTAQLDAERKGTQPQPTCQRVLGIPFVWPTPLCCLSWCLRR